MKISLSVVRLLVASLALSAAASAAPYVDPALRASRVSNDDPMKVIVMFKNAKPLPKLKGSRANYRAVRKALADNMKASQADIARLSASLGSKTAKPLWIVNGALLDVRPSQVETLAVDETLTAVYSNQQVELVTPTISKVRINDLLYTYGLTKLGIPELNSVYPNVTGDGVTVGLLDTGVDATHPDLVGKIRGWKDFTPGHSATPIDEQGHGTHTAGTIAGGRTSGTAIGVAPGVRLIVGRIFAGRTGNISEILAGMQWIADPDGNPETPDQPMLVSNSWSGSRASATMDPSESVHCAAAATWLRLGILPVASAGNSGASGAETIGLPAGCPGVLSVGSTDVNDVISPGSSRGPVKWKTGEWIAPEVSAPGVAVVSAKFGGGYTTMSGTSMAAPHVSGLSALLYQLSPRITVDEIKRRITAATIDLGPAGKDTAYGFGRVSAFRAVDDFCRNGGSCSPVTPPPAPVPPTP